MTTRRSQSVDFGDMSQEDLEALLDRQIKQDQQRRNYQNTPEAIAKRKERQAQQNRERRMVTAARNGHTDVLVEEYGLDQAQAEAFVAKAQEMSS
jgi:hypothetical protein